MTGLFGDCVGSACYEIFGLETPCQDCPTIPALNDGQSHSSCRSYQFNGNTLYIESTVSLLRDSHGIVTGTVEIIRNISERISNEQTIRDLAFHDPLTGLANRRLFEDRLGQAIAKSRRYGEPFGLLTLDLDHFKNVNDTFGHEAGDQVLREAAERIKTCCKRDLDTISRQGGDEFCIIYTDCGGREQLTAIAEKLLMQFAQPFQLADTQVDVTTSIGISIFPDNGTVIKELEIASDRAMYAAKKAGRNTYCFWEPYHLFSARKN
jgi:diguanylate cyclase (GGDEF)-like protein